MPPDHLHWQRQWIERGHWRLPLEPRESEREDQIGHKMRLYDRECSWCNPIAAPTIATSRDQSYHQSAVRPIAKVKSATPASPARAAAPGFGSANTQSSAPA